jgi:hypothetical protein
LVRYEALSFNFKPAGKNITGRTQCSVLLALLVLAGLERQSYLTNGVNSEVISKACGLLISKACGLFISNARGLKIFKAYTYLSIYIYRTDSDSSRTRKFRNISGIRAPSAHPPKNYLLLSRSHRAGPEQNLCTVISSLYGTYHSNHSVRLSIFYS